MTLAVLSDKEVDAVSGGGHGHGHRPDVDVNVTVIAHSSFTFGSVASGTNSEAAIVIGSGNDVSV